MQSAWRWNLLAEHQPLRQARRTAEQTRAWGGRAEDLQQSAHAANAMEVAANNCHPKLQHPGDNHGKRTPGNIQRPITPTLMYISAVAHTATSWAPAERRTS